MWAIWRVIVMVCLLMLVIFLLLIPLFWLMGLVADIFNLNGDSEHVPANVFWKAAVNGIVMVALIVGYTFIVFMTIWFVFKVPVMSRFKKWWLSLMLLRETSADVQSEPATP